MELELKNINNYENIIIIHKSDRTTFDIKNKTFYYYLINKTYNRNKYIPKIYELKIIEKPAIC